MKDLFFQTVENLLSREVEISMPIGKIRGKLEAYDTRFKDTPVGRREVVHYLRVNLLNYSCKDSTFKQNPGDILYIPAHSVIALGIEK